ncbi:MAG: hypothetical protein K2K57_11745 [Oscillospiraceae bacterium]|nr:hypothetical protein [Oscillospiraceae bacterium]
MLLTISGILFGAVGVWNLVMMILFFKTRKGSKEAHEKARTRFVISSSFFIASLVLFVAVLTVVWTFIDPITFM